jgi:AraC-like DNA-binding protein
LSAFVQGIWSASVSSSEKNWIEKPMHSDAGSGILFNLSHEIVLADDVLPVGVIMLPVKKRTETICLPPGAVLSGIRFHPAIGYGILGRHYQKPTLLSPQDDQLYQLYRLHSKIHLQEGDARIDTLYHWITQSMNFTHVIPDALEKALDHIALDNAPGQLTNHISLSQRQIERHFKTWLGMTPKYYQRILRIKKAMNYLRTTPNADLADVALRFGFSDQAHMTREFRSIAKTTPGKV